MHCFHAKNEHRDCRSGNWNRVLAGHAAVAASVAVAAAAVVAAVVATDVAAELAGAPVDASEHAPSAGAVPFVAAAAVGLHASDKEWVHSNWPTLELQCEARIAGRPCLAYSFR